jgi:hypothetical protein
MRPLVTDRSLATIGSISLLGEGAVDITPAPEGTPLEDWAYLLGHGIAEGSIAAVTERRRWPGRGRRLIEDLRAGKGTSGACSPTTRSTARWCGSSRRPSG